MHGFNSFFHKHRHRESTPPLDKDNSTDSWHSAASTSEDSRNSLTEPSKCISINARGSSGQRSLRGTPGSPYEHAPSPRDRYPNFASYFREVMENRAVHNAHRNHPVDYRRRGSLDHDVYQIGMNTYQLPARHDKHYVSPLYSDAMDDIDEHEYNKADKYGEISNHNINHMTYKGKFDNKSFAKKLAESVSPKVEKPERRGSVRERTSSESSGSGHKHKHSSIHEIIRTFSKKVGSWRHDANDRRGSCAIPAPNKYTESDEFRSRSKSLDGEQIHGVFQKSILDDCGATYEIFDAIVREGK